MKEQKIGLRFSTQHTMHGGRLWDEWGRSLIRLALLNNQLTVKTGVELNYKRIHPSTLPPINTPPNSSGMFPSMFPCVLPTNKGRAGIVKTPTDHKLAFVPPTLSVTLLGLSFVLAADVSIGMLSPSRARVVPLSYDSETAFRYALGSNVEPDAAMKKSDPWRL